jgi:primosomal replication protein N
VAGNRIELWGRLLKAAQIRVTPTGVPVLRMAVECSAQGDHGLVLTVTVAGERARDLATELRPGVEVSAKGVLRALRNRSAGSIIEVMADSVVLRRDRK